MRRGKIPKDILDLLRRVEEAIEEALVLYREHAVMRPEQVDEARRDFGRFYFAAVTQGLQGIRWNFDGCILCDQDTPFEGYAVLARILVTHPKVAVAAGSRALGTLICLTHADADADTLVAGALKRIRDAPPRGK